MHGSVLEFVRVEVASRGLSTRSVLEVGSLNVNGSARQFFAGDYWGVDMRPGEGVDEVCNAHDLQDSEHSGPFEVIVCTEMLEHDDDPWSSLREMAGACADGGHLLLTARGFDHRGAFPVHAYPLDFWRFSCGGLEALLWQTGWQPEVVKSDPEAPGVFAVATKCG
jgi:SAM-dependent methyltransferase